MSRIARQLLSCLTLAASIGLCAPGIVRAQYNQQPIGSLDKPMEPYAFGEVGVDETKLGSTVPDNLTFRDEAGQLVRIGDYLHKGQPVILWMGYYECPMLCDLMSGGMVRAVRSVKLDAGKEFSILNVSINPNESSGLAKAKKATYLKELGQPGNAAAWNLLVGSPESIHSLASAVGYKFKKVTVEGESQYAHPAVLMVLSPDGKVTRYLYPTNTQGVEFDPRVMQLSLIEASNGQIGSTVDRIILTCLRYDSHTGKYTWVAVRLMQYAGAATVLVMGCIFIPLWLKAARNRHADENGGAGGTGNVAMQG